MQVLRNVANGPVPAFCFGLPVGQVMVSRDLYRACLCRTAGPVASCDKTHRQVLQHIINYKNSKTVCPSLRQESVRQFDCQGKDPFAAACFGSGMAMA